MLVTTRIRRMREGNSFSLSVHTREGTPSPSHNTSTGPISFLGVPHLHPIILPLVPYPFQGLPGQDRVQVRTGYPPDRSGWGTPQTGQDRGYPGQVRMEVLQGTPHPGMGYPPDKTREGVLATQRAVCLLRSRRRTFLLGDLLNSLLFINHLILDS